VVCNFSFFSESGRPFHQARKSSSRNYLGRSLRIGGRSYRGNGEIYVKSHRDCPARIVSGSANSIKNGYEIAEEGKALNQQSLVRLVNLAKLIDSLESTWDRNKPENAKPLVPKSPSSALRPPKNPTCFD